MEEKISISYLLANEKLRDFVFEEWEKFNTLLVQGPDILKQYLCKLWNETKIEAEWIDDFDIIDLDLQVNPKDFGISYSILDNELKVLNFIMPASNNKCLQTVCASLVLAKKIPRFFVLDINNEIKNKKEYNILEWQIDFKNNNYNSINYGRASSPHIGEFLGKINHIIKSN